ncbi:hypothetical protein H310_12613 [Aphanomyces invadans]|uniref:DUF4203 domain-containing protein n=1 Tax=Aphanomyces invadans TaxID=157072 RepID=A0A024TH17_9STRA|nr:hypothetical protein H310_12613 [Aphanomyces invadans]ETV93348.1 hypothetical protein H310_12613 [Aphanomyces invadans]RHY25180.1 hypothetical protein DYB32_008479 [Aphanomyces invadans]|eukprot:XP_008877984.1 hypothetical protein H310_12613 [Aphanomyces invadans]
MAVGDIARGGSPQPHRRHLYTTYDSVEDTRLIISMCLSVVLVAAGVRVTDFGVKSMQLSVFLSTLAVASMALVFVDNIWIAVLVACALGIVLSIVPALCRRCSVLVVGMGFGATVVSLVYTLVLELLDERTIEVDVGAATTTVIVASICGHRALERDMAYLIAATSCTGAFTVSTAIAAGVHALGRQSTMAIFKFVLGAALMAGDIVFQKARMVAAARTQVQVATPVDDGIA